MLPKVNYFKIDSGNFSSLKNLRNYSIMGIKKIKKTFTNEEKSWILLSVLIYFGDNDEKGKAFWNIFIIKTF